MLNIWWAVFVVVVAWIAWGVRVYRILSRRRRYPWIDEEPLSPAWLNENVYTRDGRDHR